MGKITHGKTNTRIYRIWLDMIARCERTTCVNYHRYGARGIQVCKDWHKFENFLADMGEGEKGLEIDRINNEEDYKPSNCKWSSRKEQSNNRRTNKNITFNGITLTVREWERKQGFNKHIIKARLALGWSIKDALLTQVSRGNRYKGVSI